MLGTYIQTLMKQSTGFPCLPLLFALLLLLLVNLISNQARHETRLTLSPSGSTSTGAASYASSTAGVSGASSYKHRTSLSRL